MRNKKNPATSGTPPESAEPGTPRINPEKYYKDSGMYEHFKNSGITIRFTNSAEALKRQQVELWNDYLERCKAQYEKEGAKIENSDIEIFRHGFIENEVKLFTGFLGQTQPERNKAETRKYLNEVTKELEQLNAHTPDPPAPDQRLSHDKIALINYYNGITITENNAAGIAQKSGWISKTSGRKLWQRYLYFTSNANRNAIPDNPTQTTKRNKIKLFESVLPYLNDTGKQKAEAEIKVLKIKLQTEG